ncbi:MAG: hypothetical protein A2V66_09595 [Ignavibacteria bacterium RBG_13_36_8]|nr:MAG: hypothetical protein A2V66_09595 [Ignavibacteria bacterium RBG_13_36_8]
MRLAKLNMQYISNNTSEWEKEIWISCLSYEERTKDIILTKLTKDFKVLKGIFFQNTGIIDKIDVEFKNSLKTSPVFKELMFQEVDYRHPTRFIKDIYTLFERSFKKIEEFTINIDISTFPRIELLILLYILNDLKIPLIRLFYVPVKEYGEWLSKGFERKIVIPFFEGTTVTNKKNLLVVFAGFDIERISKLIEEIEPHLIIVCRSVEGFSDDFNKRVDKFIKNDLVFNSNNYEVIDTETQNVEKIQSVLVELVSKYQKDYNILICPSGTKLQLLACFLVFLHHPTIQFVYSIPISYNYLDYSKGAGKLYAFELKQDVKE